VVIPIKLDDERCRCPGCETSYRLLSRELVSVRSRVDERGGYRHLLLTREAGGRTRPRALHTVKPVQFVISGWLTLVWRGSTLVGIVTDQARPYWLPQEAPATAASRYGRVWSVCLAAATLIGLVYLTRIGTEVSRLHAAGRAPLVVWFALALAVLAPLAWWALRTASEGEPEQDLLAPDEDDPFALDA